MVKINKNLKKAPAKKSAQTSMSATSGVRRREAARMYRMPSIGLPQRLRATIGWVAGTSFVGNGTNGVANSVYMKPASGVSLVGPSAGGSSSRCWWPAAPTDASVGRSYMTDIMKHYSRLVIHKARVCLVSLHPSTANDCTVQLAVARGPGMAQQGYVTTLATATTVAATTAEIVPLPSNSRMSAASYESMDLDVTGFIAGGSGPKQNEFEINADSAQTAWWPAFGTATALDGEGLVPFSLIVAGTNSTAALQNLDVHDVVIEYEMELLDFIGSMTLLAPVGVAVETPSGAERVAELYSEIAKLTKAV